MTLREPCPNLNVSLNIAYSHNLKVVLSMDSIEKYQVLLLMKKQFSGNLLCSMEAHMA